MSLPYLELFRIGPNGLQEISDDTLEVRLTEEERRRVRRVVDIEMAQRECALSQVAPLKAV